MTVVMPGITYKNSSHDLWEYQLMERPIKETKEEVRTTTNVLQTAPKTTTPNDWRNIFRYNFVGKPKTKKGIK